MAQWVKVLTVQAWWSEFKFQNSCVCGRKEMNSQHFKLTSMCSQWHVCMCASIHTHIHSKRNKHRDRDTETDREVPRETDKDRETDREGHRETDKERQWGRRTILTSKKNGLGSVNECNDFGKLLFSISLAVHIKNCLPICNTKVPLLKTDFNLGLWYNTWKITITFWVRHSKNNSSHEQPWLFIES